MQEHGNVCYRTERIVKPAENISDAVWYDQAPVMLNQTGQLK